MEDLITCYLFEEMVYCIPLEEMLEADINRKGGKFQTELRMNRVQLMHKAK